MSATGCYKCGRPGHWSRDCPSSAPDQNPHSSADRNPPPPRPPPPSSSKPYSGGGARFSAGSSKSAEKPKKVPRSRPKLTPDLLLSDDGLGYVLRYFPREFKYRGRGHEVQDLGNLLRMYTEWHSRLIPYYSFDQFVLKVEKVAATKRVKMCLRDLRERVANGGDPTKLNETPVGQEIPAEEQVNGEANHEERDLFSEPQNVNDMQEDMIEEFFNTATEEPSQSMQNEPDANAVSKSIATEEASNVIQDKEASMSGKDEITEEQRARMEENRLKALQRRAARAAAISQAS
ncbi:hypothetical protein HN51_010545 [Arachis hypogaea]|uniref:CCHC-type domain-containing protein n=2 Tax=Arachis TaxID=3817 RepID=A0A445E2R2_ARAHY|nr:uncharacterized protein LOC107477201 [Arachis duranensis]XP_025686780.1 TIMELESS-interacting protein [Arachis hypogaea]XP_057752245.1 uncharacterized protein LOC130970249 [Arachis stenosperma]RYR69729.1 hypothetical protein Ahy_A03g016277 [Arachis hypogaea]